MQFHQVEEGEDYLVDDLFWLERGGAFLPPAPSDEPKLDPEGGGWAQTPSPPLRA